MTSPRELLDAYGAAIPALASLDPRETIAPKAFAALRAVLDQHPLVTVQVGGPDGSYIPVCRSCSVMYTEDWKGWPCPTVQAIITELEKA